MAKITDYQSLERYFFKEHKKSGAVLAGPHDYETLYKSILQNLKEKIYPAIDIGLTLDGGVFTFHNSDHFDQVVVKAGELLGIDSRKKNDLTAYEIFVLLVAIRIHDAGNCYGRDQHEKRCEDILSDINVNFFYLETELHTIAQIAQAHGGKTPDGGKDVIGLLEDDHVGGAKVRSQRLAALVRLADELAENNARIPTVLQHAHKIPKKNEVYHCYGRALQSNCVEPLEKGCKVTLRYRFTVEDAYKKFGKDSGDIYLVDEIKNRLIKMNKERVYCNQFLNEHEKLVSIHARIEIRDHNHKIAWTDEFSLRDEGYPDHLSESPSCLHAFSGESIVYALGEKS